MAWNGLHLILLTAGLLGLNTVASRADFDPREPGAFLCITSDGGVRLHFSKSIAADDDKCKWKANVIGEAINTPRLTSTASVFFDTDTVDFMVRGGGEFTPAGQDLLLLDERIGPRTLIFSLTSHRFVLANLSSKAGKL